MKPGTPVTDRHGTRWRVLGPARKPLVAEPLVRVECVTPGFAMRGLDPGDVRVLAVCALTAVES